MEKKVLLLAILKKETDESFKDVLIMLENARVMSLKEGKRLLKELKKEKLIDDAGLTPKGLKAAKEAEEEFRL